MTGETSDRAEPDAAAATEAAPELKPLRTMQSLQEDLSSASQDWVTEPGWRRKVLTQNLLDGALEAERLGTAEGDKMAESMRKKAKTIEASARG